MGIFSTKKIVCAQCGKEFEGRGILAGKLCPDCAEKAAEDRSRITSKEIRVSGYVDYAREMFWPNYTEEQLDQINERRTQILEKYRMTNGISKKELETASDNYKKLTDDEAADVLMRMANSSVSNTTGAAYTGNFFVPTGFSKTIVDVQDVFAVGYTSDSRSHSDSHETILCAVFTNDPYIPVFPMLYVGKLGFFEIMKSKKGRKGVSATFELLCPNLTYPVQDLKLLKKQIKSDGSVKGNLEQKFVLDQISSATAGTGIFNTKHMLSTLLPASSDMLEEYGYIQETEINSILKMDKMFNRNYWKKQIKRLADYDIGE